jgi:hypothetical protein
MCNLWLKYPHSMGRAWCFEQPEKILKKFYLPVRPQLSLKNLLWSPYHFRMGRASSCKGRRTNIYLSFGACRNPDSSGFVHIWRDDFFSSLAVAVLRGPSHENRATKLALLQPNRKGNQQTRGSGGRQSGYRDIRPDNLIF